MLGKRYRGSRLSFDYGVTNQMTISGLKQISLFQLDVCGVWTLALAMVKTKKQKAEKLTPPKSQKGGNPSKSDDYLMGVVSEMGAMIELFEGYAKQGRKTVDVDEMVVFFNKNLETKMSSLRKDRPRAWNRIVYAKPDPSKSLPPMRCSASNDN